MGCHFLLQLTFLTQGLNPDFLHWRQILYHLSHQGSPERSERGKEKKKVKELFLHLTSQPFTQVWILERVRNHFYIFKYSLWPTSTGLSRSVW